MERELLVYMDRADAPVLVGRLWSRVRHGKATSSFVYDDAWRVRADAFALELEKRLPFG